MGAVYGGGEDGHVYENTAVNITGGLIGLSVYGAGKGISMYKGYLRDQNTKNFKSTTEDLYSWTAGKVYGNATVTMTGGHVLNNVYGGGYLGSVGKGNYAGGADDYYKEGYGETLQGNLWASTTEGDNAWQFLNSGKATVIIEGGTIGTLNGTYGNVGGSTDPTPSGMVFGGSRGQSAEDVMLDPRYEYAPNFYLGYVNNTEVTIGTTEGGAPRIYSQVFGGGRDGHVRGNAHVIVNNGIIGQTYTETEAVAGSTADYQRYHRGNVYGSGSGLGQWTTGKHGMSSGSVTRNTTVDINGGTIYNNVYGGGALSSVGPPRLDPEKDYAPADWSKCVVNINGGTIGDPTVYDEHEYGGCVYGASRGNDFATDESPDNFATVLWTQVNINPHPSDRSKDAVIAGNVYGGAKGGLVWKDTEVNLKGGRIYHDAYGGGQGTTTPNIAANVGGTTVELNKNVATTDKGCIVERIFGCNDLNGTPRGHVKVHVFATQNKATNDILHKIAPDPYSTKRITSTTPEEGYKAWLQRLIGIAKPGGNVLVGLDETVISAAETVLSSFSDVDEDVLAKDNDKKKSISDAALTVIKQIERQHDYDVKAVYGGGNLAIYEPYGPAANNTEADFKATKEYTEVIIEGCDVTSIKQVYGGGNAASVPATNVSVKSVFIIDELFGGGNGFDHYTINDKWYENPGANIGYYATEEHDTDDTTNNGSTEDKRYRTVAKPNSSTKEDRQQYYAYGSGRAETTVTGGHIHTVYGGSNEKGNIREVALSQYQKSGTCPLVTDESYGGSKRAEMDGEIQVVMDCVENGGIYFGGSQDADINNNVTINITNGSYQKVYGGNKKAGTINGAITINIEEKGCTPIEIGELYGGGFKAPYSIYGYQKDSNGKLVTVDDPVEKDDEGNPIKNRIPLRAGDTGALTTPHRDPYINIISATSIGTIYGGGDQALVIGSPHVNVNMQEGIILKEYAQKLPGYSSLTIENGGKDADGNKILPIGTIGSIYGGGNLASVEGNTFVDIGTGSWYNYKEKAIEAISRKEANITGNVYGGGKGKADNFTCDKAMVGHDGGGVTNDEGNTSVTIGYGTIGGSVYGGGEIGRVENNADVTIGIASGTGPVIMGDVYGAGQGVPTHGYSGLTRGNTTVTVQGSSKVMGSVYGGGEMASVGSYNIATTQALADEYHVEVGMPYGLKSGGKNTVVVTDSAEIGPDNMVMHNKVTGKPDDKGHVFGAGRGVVAYETINPGRWYMKKISDTVSEYTWEAYGEANESDYLRYTKTLGLSDHTEVTIEGDAFIKGSVYGGAENGHVRTDTHVIIDGNCQIGNGYVQMTDDGTYLDSLESPLIPIAVNRRYTAAEWAGRKLITTDADPVELRTLAATYYKSSLPECASWRYGHDTDGDGKNDVFASYDKFASTVSGHEEEYPLEYGQSEAKSTDGGRRVASDGHTFYGNVFGGGSGYYPYKAGRWNFDAGSVGGNCVLEIKGGHILTNAYGASEFANTSGSTTVTMTGGTIGVPRTLGQIAAHPVTCYLFGAGKGDQRLFFNKETNVQDVTITVSGDTIYGSVFGGGEDGHVLGNVTMNINSGAWIGTWGTSYVDGNVFGGGRGFSGEALTAGNVAGTIAMNINGGTMLGSIYGGGRLASVGYGLFLDEGDELEHYGEMIEDGKKQVFNDDRTTSIEDGAGVKHGHIDINIKGGTIGNDNEYKYFTVNVDTDGKTSGEIIRARDAALAAQKTANDMPDTDFELSDSTTNGTVRTYDYRLTHTKGGNVFCGSMGRMYYLDGTPIPNWTQLGNVKSTKLHITGGTIKSNVYGGGELGFVSGKHAVQVGDSLSTEILIDGGTIGTEIKDGNTTKYSFGSVYGGGRGSTIERFAGLTGLNEYPKYYAAIIEDSTQIVMNDGAVKASIYGGGEVGNVKGSANVTINGGTIGIDHQGDTYFGGARIGNVFGGGSGDRTISRCGAVHTNTTVNITGGTIYHNVYGGGSYGSVGTYDYEMGYEEQFGANKVQDILNVTNGTSRVNITGGTIGINGNENGMVFGSGRGEISAPGERDKRDNFLGWVNDSHVTIGTKNGGIGDTQPKVRGSVYGSGENGHNFNDATVNIHSGVIGITEGSPVTYKGKPCSGPDYPYRGNVYGAGCGTDTYIDLATGEEKYNPWAGIVFGNTTVNIDGGLIVQNVYGGGSMGSVGKIKVNYAMMADPNNAQQLIPDRTKPDTASVYKHADVRMITDANGVTKEVVYGFGLSWPYEFTFEKGGKATINITGGHLGIYGHDGGDVFGAARGDAGDRYKTSHLARVNETEVNIKYPTTANLTDTTNLAAAFITGSVHGSGEDGYVYGDTHVTLTGGLVCHSLYGGGKGKGTYTQKLLKIGATAASATANDYYDAEIYSLISGKVMGNTYVNMSGGRVMRNVYGGGNIASVGKGNYAGGPDDYYPAGYGETLTGENNKLWTSTFDDSKEVSTTNKPDTAYYFLNSGKTNVVVTGGTIGYIDSANPDNSFKNGLPYGNVFGGSTGEAAPNVDRNLSPRYHYCPSFFSGYVNETDVTIGTEGSETGPVILGSVYGGGQDGHVRRWTNVKINSGTIGLPFNAENKTLLKTSDPSDEQWLYRGNVYGAGSGISQYKYNKVTTSGTTTETGYSTSAGSVSHFTQVEVKGGTIYRNVLGGGSLATVGPPKIGAPDYAAIKGANAADWGKQSLNMVTIGGGKTADNKTAIVTIGEQNGVNAGYGGNVFGGSRGEGEATLGSNFASFATSIWTKVLIRDGANILGNVFGGGNAGEVMKDTDVQIGDKKVVTPENP